EGRTTGGGLRLVDVFGLARRVAGAAHLGLVFLGADEHGLASPLAARAADRDLAFRLDAVSGFTRQIERPRHSGENAYTPAELPRLALRFDADAAGERDERDLAVAGVRGERAAAHAEVQVLPARGLRRHLLPGARPEQQVVHTWLRSA